MSFVRSHHALLADHASLRSLAVFTLVLAALAAWTWWAVAARVSVHAVSADARLEVEGTPFRITAPVDGVVVTTRLTVDRTVTTGEVLVALDPRQEHLREAEARARVDGVGPQVQRLDAEVVAHERSRSLQQTGLDTAQREALARAAAAQAAADLADEEARRVRALRADGWSSAADAAKAESELLQKRAAAAALHLATERVTAERAERDAAVQARLEELARTRAALLADVTSATATATRLRHEQRLRQLEAPVSGRIAESAPVSVGSMLRAGDAVATIVPDSALHVVASFTPAEAFGRVRPGQPARVRLDGFPHTQFGAVPALVSRVAAEVRDGRVRVELRLTSVDVPVPLQHGAPASVEVTVESISPMALALRAMGRRVAAPVVHASR